ncbi:MAG: hypothetical protein Q7J84_02290 [Sulfuricaulis sp.]|nr:hypothetical protein [Sulfuricaulis sp.]
MVHVRVLATLIVGSACLATLGLACGGDADESLDTPASTPSATALKRDERDDRDQARLYVDDLCSKELVDWFVLAVELSRGEQPETLEELAVAFDNLEAEAGSFYRHVSSVEPPNDMQEWHTKLLTGLQGGRSLGRDFEAAVTSGNEDDLAEITKRAERLVQLFDELDRMEVPAEYAKAWEDDCFPKIKARIPEAELN